jgi:hypothetical protein
MGNFSTQKWVKVTQKWVKVTQKWVKVTIFQARKKWNRLFLGKTYLFVGRILPILGNFYLFWVESYPLKKVTFLQKWVEFYPFWVGRVATSSHFAVWIA